MSIENLLTSLKESLDRNTEALTKLAASGAGVVVDAGEKAKPAADKPAKAEKAKPAAEKPAKEEAPKVTQEQMQAALIKIKDDFGMDHAKAIIKEAGNADKMGDIKPAQYQAVYDAAIARHAELTAEANGADDDSL